VLFPAGTAAAGTDAAAAAATASSLDCHLVKLDAMGQSNKLNMNLSIYIIKYIYVLIYLFKMM
jgi:hypothetical protein